jgi:hypothetical protein
VIGSRRGGRATQSVDLGSNASRAAPRRGPPGARPCDWHEPRFASNGCAPPPVQSALAVGGSARARRLERTQLGQTSSRTRPGASRGRQQQGRARVRCRGQRQHAPRRRAHLGHSGAAQLRSRSCAVACVMGHSPSSPRAAPPPENSSARENSPCLPGRTACAHNTLRSPCAGRDAAAEATSASRTGLRIGNGPGTGWVIPFRSPGCTHHSANVHLPRIAPAVLP